MCNKLIYQICDFEIFCQNKKKATQTEQQKKQNDSRFPDSSTCLQAHCSQPSSPDVLGWGDLRLELHAQRHSLPGQPGSAPPGRLLIPAGHCPGQAQGHLLRWGRHSNSRLVRGSPAASPPTHPSIQWDVHFYRGQPGLIPPKSFPTLLPTPVSWGSHSSLVCMDLTII